MGDDDKRPVLVAIGPHAEIDVVLDAAAAAAEAERPRRVARLVHVIARADAAQAGRLRLALAEERLRERPPTPARVQQREKR
jgi:hypothetical protein